MDTRTFPPERTHELLATLLTEHQLELDAQRRSFASSDGRIRLTPPPVQPIPESAESPRDYLQSLPDSLGAHLVLLLRAGATALGLWQQGQLLRHKVIKKYVVRGRGRAQPTHLKTKGKSRYGSRLRLQNWQRQLIETNQKLNEWHAEQSPPDLCFYSCPVRSWPELWAVDPPPPEPRDHWTKIRFHVHTPDFEELRRTYTRLCRGTCTIAV